MKLTKVLLAATPMIALAALPALGQDPAPVEVPEAVQEVVAAMPNPGNTAWMITASVLVLFMTIPGLALFYGGLVRSKNMLSVLMQVMMIAAVVGVIWLIYGYSFAFGGSESPYWGGTAKLFLAGVNAELDLGHLQRRGHPRVHLHLLPDDLRHDHPRPHRRRLRRAHEVRRGDAFSILWVTFVYFPIAHMVWDGNGLLFQWGALDFAGGTVVHINAGIAGLVGCIMVGKRIGLGKDMMAPNSMTLTMVGAAMLWVGWFGFNAGSNLEANGGTTVAVITTFAATAAAIVAWVVIESFTRGKASMLGACSGLVAGLVAVTPAAGLIGPMGAIILGIVAVIICYFFVSVVKPAIGYDDSLDVFGIHGIGGIVGAIGTGILVSDSLGGVGYADGVTMGGQVWTQILAVIVTIVWCGVVSIILYKIVDLIIGLRVTPEVEREGLDLASHGEAAYHP